MVKGCATDRLTNEAKIMDTKISEIKEIGIKVKYTEGLIKEAHERLNRLYKRLFKEKKEALAAFKRIDEELYTSVIDNEIDAELYTSGFIVNKKGQ